MMGRRTLLALVVLCLLVTGTVNPPRVHAGFDVTDGLIIGGITLGVVSAIALIAILATDKDDEPDFLTQAPPRRDQDLGGHFGFEAIRRCPPVGGNVSLVCW